MRISAAKREAIRRHREEFEVNAPIAEKVHNVIMKFGDNQLKAEYEKELKIIAGMRQGAWAIDLAAYPPTPVSAFVRQEIFKALGEKNVKACEYIHETGEMSIQLRDLAEALPDKVLSQYFTHDPKEVAQKEGVDFEAFKRTMKGAFRGTVGTPGEDDFGVLIDAVALIDAAACKGYAKSISEGACYSLPPGAYARVLGMGTGARSTDLDDLEETDLDPFKHPHGSLVCIEAGRSPCAVRVLAQILNFQGASHYLPKEVGK